MNCYGIYILVEYYAISWGFILERQFGLFQ